MVRALCLLAVLAACGSERAAVTSKVTTLGYARPPAIVIVARGEPELVAPWVASLRASTAARVIAEISSEETDKETTCRDALSAANVEPIDEILVVDVTKFEQYMSVRISTKVTAYRASSCEVVRSTTLPVATGTTETAIGFLQEIAQHTTWNVFPRDSSIQRIEGQDLVIAGPLTLGEYFVKTPWSAKLEPGVVAASRTHNMTTLRIDPEVPMLEAGDELHTVTDMMTVAGYTSVSMGTARAQGAKHGVAGAAIAARWTWDQRPAMMEFQLGGDLIPGVDSRHISFAVAGGVRWPRRHLSPVAFLELGLGAAYQGDHGARAVAGHAGIGAGLELRFTRWFAFADARVRGFALSDWTDSEEHPLVVTYPDQTWSTMTGQLGVGINF